MLLHFILLKLLQVGSICRWAPLTLFGNSLFLFCTFGCFTFLPFVREPFLILWNVKRGFCFATTFHCCLLILNSVFCILILEAFTLIIVMTKAIACIWKLILQVGSFLLRLSLLKYFLSQALVTQWLISIFSIFRCKYYKKLRLFGLPASLCVTKSKAFLYLKQSCLILGAIRSFVKNSLILLKIFSATFLE